MSAEGPLPARADVAAVRFGEGPTGRIAAEYVLSLRWPAGGDTARLTGYLTELAAMVDVTVVDGSDPAARREHLAAWGGLARVLAPADRPGRNRKVASVVTGVGAARHEAVVIADDDVRYSAAQLARTVQLLAEADLVCPQNHFEPAPWHARWDTARSLLNRALGHDYPGTFGLRRSTFLAMGGYDGDVLFENLQLIRTVRRWGGVVRTAPELYVRRLPPGAQWFARQRVRQAYDDFAQPARLVVEAALLPAALLGAHRWRRVALLAGTSVLLAEWGRRRKGGRQVWPATAAWWAPVWLAERAVCVWLAIFARIRGGVKYHGVRLPCAARPVQFAPKGHGEGMVA